MRKKAILLLVAVLLTAGAGFHLVAATAQEAEVTKAHDAFRENWVKFDADAIGKMLADDFVWIARNGVFGDKASMVDDFRRHAMTKPDHSESVRVRMYGDTGIVTAVNFGTMPSGNGASKTGTTEVWVRRGSGWIMASFQGTDLPKQ
jgi:ketosteroid isomerase-like protein